MFHASFSHPTHVCQKLLCQRLPLFSFPVAVKDDQTPTSLQAVSRHFQLIHGVDVLNMTLDTGTVWRSRNPEVEVFMTSSFKVEGVGAGMQVGELVE